MIVLIVFGVMACLVYLLHTHHYSRHWSKQVQVELEFSQEQAGEGESLYLYETAVNNKEMRLPAICVKFGAAKELQFADAESGTVSDHFYRNDVMSVDGYQKVKRKLRFTCKRRGIYEIQEAQIVSYDLFFSHTFAKKVEVYTSLCVYPSRISVNRLLPVFRELNGGLPTNVALYEDPYAYAGVREYTPQDSMRRIHWKASARTGAWQVKTMEYIAAAPVNVLLNLESPGVFTDTDLMEESIRVAYSLIYYLNGYGIQTTLAVNADERFRMSGSGRSYMNAVRHALAATSYRHVTEDGEQFMKWARKFSTPGERVVFISPAGKKPLQEQVLCWLKQKILLTWVAPLISSQSLESDFRDVLPELEVHLIKWGGNG